MVQRTRHAGRVAAKEEAKSTATATIEAEPTWQGGIAVEVGNFMNDVAEVKRSEVFPNFVI